MPAKRTTKAFATRITGAEVLRLAAANTKLLQLGPPALL
jgi:hypothetical protein